MTFLGLERPVDWVAQQTFNPATAAMVLSAQKDYANAVYAAYQDAKQDMKDFNKEYGDFLSPIQRDMDWYAKNVTGDIRNFVNDLYAQGIDPLRSQEGRALVARKLASIPTEQISQLRQSAEVAKEYLKSFDDDTNPELEAFLGRNLNTWSTLGDPENGIEANGIWNVRSRTKFQDLNNWTHHLFDDMELSYDPEESKKHPGFMAYTKSKDTMNKIVDTHIAELLGTDLGKFYYNSILKSLPDSIENKDKIALDELKSRIVDANWENNQMKLESDPYALARYQNRLRSSGSGGGGSRTPSTKMSFNYMNGLFQRGLTNAFGYDPTTGEETAINNIMSDQIGFGQSMRRGSFSGPWAAYKSLRSDYMGQFTIQENPVMFAGILGRQMDKEGGIPLTRADLDNFRTEADVVTSTYGYPYPHINTNLDKIKKEFNGAPVIKREERNENGGTDVFYDGLKIVPYQDVYTSYQRYGQNGAVDQQWKVAVINTYNGQHLGDFWYTIPNTREYNVNIPSIREWGKNSEGRYEVSGDDSKTRGLAKAGINQNVRGSNERASWVTTGMFGVTQQPFNRDVTYNQEGVALSPYR